MSNSNSGKVGGSAFPRAGYSPVGNGQADGMSLRDYFAAKAMQGILAGVLADGSRFDTDGASHAADAAYKVADAMLAERAK